MTDLTVSSLAVMGTTLFVGTWGGGIFRSEDRGNNWIEVNNGLTYTWIRSLAIIGTTLFAGTDADGVFRSDDKGDNWIEVNNGLTNLQINSLAIIGATLFAATDVDGVFRSEDRGNNWIEVNNGLTNLQKAPAPPHPPKSWKIAFVRDGNIWVANGDGTGQKLIIKNGESPCWSPDKKRIAFARDSNVWVANADGSEQRQLTFNGRVIDISWDPKANFITFSHWEEFQVTRIGSEKGEVIVGCSIFDVPLEPARKGEILVRFDLYDAEAAFHFSHHSYPTWSKSGDRLAFVRNGDIWVANRIEGKQISSEREWEWDATRLAAVAGYDASTWRGSRNTIAATRLSWSPDEKYLVYGYQRLGGSGFEEIALLNVQTDKSHSLNTGLDPCFSPDGRYIAYTWGEDIRPWSENIWVVSPDGKTPRELVGNAKEPAW